MVTVRLLGLQVDSDPIALFATSPFPAILENNISSSSSVASKHNTRLIQSHHLYTRVARRLGPKLTESAHLKPTRASPMQPVVAHSSSTRDRCQYSLNSSKRPRNYPWHVFPSLWTNATKTRQNPPLLLRKCDIATHVAYFPNSTRPF